MTSPRLRVATAAENVSAFVSFTLELSVTLFDAGGHLFFGLCQFGCDMGILTREDLRREDAAVGGAGFADCHCCYLYVRRNLHPCQQTLNPYATLVRSRPPG